MMRGPRSVVVGRLENLQRRMRLLSAYGDLIGPLSSEIPGRGSERGISLLRLRWPFKWINQVVFPPIFDAPPQSINLIIIPVRSFVHSLARRQELMLREEESTEPNWAIHFDSHWFPPAGEEGHENVPLYCASSWNWKRMAVKTEIPCLPSSSIHCIPEGRRRRIWIAGWVVINKRNRADVTSLSDESLMLHSARRTLKFHQPSMDWVYYWKQDS